MPTYHRNMAVGRFMAYAIGVDLGATNIKTLAVGPEGNILLERTAPTEDGPDRKWAATIRDAIAAIEGEMGAVAEQIGLCAPGLIHADEHAVSWMVDRMVGTIDFDRRAYLERPGKVPFLNDGHAALYGEVWLGAAQGMRNVVALTLGTGVGGGIMIEGKLLKGHIGRAGQLGHVGVDAKSSPDLCNMPGGLDDLIGNATVARRSDGRFRDTAELVKAYEAGDEGARTLWLASLHYLACGICSLINTVDPQAVVLGGGMIQAGASLFDPLDQAMARVEWRPNGYRVPIVPARLGAYAGAVGAAGYAMGVTF
jgi:glucokinase